MDRMNTQLTHEHTDFTKKQFPITIVCDHIKSPANIGSIFRLADSFGVQKIYFCGQDIPINSTRMLRTARSTTDKIQFEYDISTQEVLQQIEKNDNTFIALEITSQSMPIWKFDFKKAKHIILWIGGERNGISASVLNKIDTTLHIPMFGKNSSMNAATATGIALYEITKQYCF